MTKIILQTPRLILRTWQESDIPLMAAISSDPVVMEFFPSLQDYDHTQKMVEYIMQHHEQHGYGLYAVELKDTQEFIGFVGLDRTRFTIPSIQLENVEVVEIGWRLSAKHWNKGYATEAATAVLNYAFNVLKIPEIFSFTAVVNQRSRHVMEKIGLQYSSDFDFDHPKLPEGHPLRRHVLYRLKS